MTKVKMETELPVEPDDVWETIGRFNALQDWHPAVEESELEEGGRVRRLKLAGGGEIVERLEQLDEEGHAYRYSILSSPLPVGRYTATIRVRPAADGKGSVVEWSSDFEPQGSEQEALETIQGIYRAGFDNLRKLFGG